MNMPYMPVDLSTHGASLDRLNLWVHILMALLFVGWGLFFLYTLFRFSAKRNPKADYNGVQSHTSSYLELGVALFEAVLLFGLSIPLWADWVSVDGKNSEAVHLRVIAQQFAWNVHYPGADGQYGKLDVKLVSDSNAIGLDRTDERAKDDVVLNNAIIIPKGRPVRIELTTKDVIHSFFLPAFRVKQDTMPAESIPVLFEATKTSLEYRQEEAKANPGKHRRIRARELFYDASNKNADGTPKRTMDAILVDVEKEFATDESVVHIVRDLEIACAQLCGGQHYRMRGQVHVVDDATFNSLTDPGKWVMWLFKVQQQFNNKPTGEYPGAQ